MDILINTKTSKYSIDISTVHKPLTKMQEKKRIFLQKNSKEKEEYYKYANGFLLFYCSPWMHKKGVRES